MGSWRGGLALRLRTCLLTSPTSSPSVSFSTLPCFSSAAFELSPASTQLHCGRLPAAVFTPGLDLSLPAHAQIFPAFRTSPSAASPLLVSEQARFFQHWDAVLQRSGFRNCGYVLAGTSDSRTQSAELFGPLLLNPALRSSVRLPGAFGTEDFSMEADSVKRKRKRKMNKHKHRKLRRRLRKSGK